MAVRQDVAEVSIGDFKKTVTHAAIKREKNNFTCSFASGACSVRNVRITTK